MRVLHEHGHACHSHRQRAAPDSWFSHLAFSVPGENCANEWPEPVIDEQYGQLG